MRLNLYATDEERERIAKDEKRSDRIKNVSLLVIVFAVTVGVGCWLYSQHVRQVRQTARLDNEGRRIIGTIDNNYTVLTRKDGETRYEVTYSFIVGEGNLSWLWSHPDSTSFRSSDCYIRSYRP